MNRVACAAVVGALLVTTTACAPSVSTSSEALDASTLDSATLAYMKENASLLAAQMGISDPPAVEPIRLITLDEWASTQIACLQDAGYDVDYTADGEGVAYPNFDDESLIAALNIAVYTCELQYPTQLKYMAPLSTSQLEVLYAYRTGELVQCLQTKGYEVASTPPSKTVFVQSGGVWSPYDEINIQTDDMRTINKDCPQTPESLYGG